MRIEENKTLAPLTTFGMGGPARWFIEARSETEIGEAAAWAKETGVAVFVLGGGSNLLVSDQGFDGLVMRVGLRGIVLAEEREQHALFEVGAGEDWDAFVEHAVGENCAGVECMAGIPGTVGGTPVQNVGAYGQEVASAIVSVRAFDLREHHFVELGAEECGFAYRRSRFNSVDRGRYAVTRVRYGLRRGGTPEVHYPELRKALGENAQPGLAELATTVRRVRQGKGMLLVEGDPDCRSAGSFFKNPVVESEAVAGVAQAAGKEPSCYPAGAGKVKLSAAWLIEQAGFTRGFSMGAAGVSSKHTLALVNRGGATAEEILALAARIAGTVGERFGIRLEMEPVMVGF